MALSDRNLTALDAVLKRAAVDREFRKTLLEQPHRALQSALGTDLPRHLRIRFIEKDPGLDALIVLPDLESESGALDPSQLDAVAGGEGAFWDDLLE